MGSMIIGLSVEFCTGAATQQRNQQICVGGDERRKKS